MWYVLGVQQMYQTFSGGVRTAKAYTSGNPNLLHTDAAALLFGGNSVKQRKTIDNVCAVEARRFDDVWQWEATINGERTGRGIAATAQKAAINGAKFLRLYATKYDRANITPKIM